MRRLRLLGHPLHPPTVHLPLGLWSAAALWDAAALLTGRPELWTLAFGCLVLGCAAALPALATGLLDFAALEKEGAETAALWHMGLMSGCLLLYGASAALRGGAGEPSRPAFAVAAELAGLACLSLGGWLGGQLVYAHGAGVGVESYNGGNGPKARRLP